MESAISDTNASPNYPLLTERVQSTFIDTIFIIIMMFVFSTILDRYENVPDWLRIFLFIGLWLIYANLYHVGLYFRKLYQEHTG